MTGPRGAAGPEPAGPLIPEAAALALLFAGILAFFWPVFVGRLPAPGDGYVHSFPHLALLGRALAAGSLPLWNPYEFSGFPWLATGQAGVLYPPNWIAAILPPVTAMTVVVLSTYLIAGLGTYRLARHLGASPPAAVVGGYTYALSGFMVAHLGHTPMVNAAAWLPWLFLAVEQLRGAMRWPWFAAASGIVGMQVAAGHFQVPVYGGLAVAIYVVVTGGEERGWRARLGWFGRVALVGVAGGLLAAVQIFPAVELARESARARISYEFFSGYHLPLRQLPMLLFPYLFGGAQSPSPFPDTYLGRWGLSELTGYPGIFPLVLAASAGTVLWRQPRVRGWLALALVALILALGPATPVSNVLYAVPGYNEFRVPARHLMSFGLAVAILAALGLGRLLGPLQYSIRRRASRCAWAVAGGMALLAAATLVRPSALEPVLPPALPDARAQAMAVAVPLGFGGLAVGTVGLLRRTRSRAVQAFALCLSLTDLASFGQFFEWRAGPTAGSVNQDPPPVTFLRRVANEPPLRIFIAGERAALGFFYGAWRGLPSANGYDPLILERYSQFLGMSPAGIVPDVWRLARGRQLDLLGVSHVVVSPPRRFLTRAGPVALLAAGEGVEYDVSGDDPVVLRVVSTFAYIEELPEGTPVARVVVFPETGDPQAEVLRAGIETGAWDSSGRMNPHTPQRRHSGVRSFTRSQDDRTLIALYDARLVLGKSRRILRVRIEHAAPAPDLLFGVRQVEAVAADGRTITLTGPAVLLPPPGWVRVFRDATVDVYENPNALPRAWLVPGTMVLRDDAAVLEAIRAGLLPDGRAFEPRAVALLSGRAPGAATRDGTDPPGDVEIRLLSSNRIELDVRAPAGGYLVLSEVDYPGWRATLDGAPVRHDRVNYVLRGLPIPPGTHRVSFVFRPRSVLWGGLMSAATGVVLVVLAWREGRFK